ncbi:MAG: ABC transporter permease subunit [Opitutaceae bacterium]|nr:ABC transporter permease subunit [Opitutaceae bacterium]
MVRFIVSRFLQAIPTLLVLVTATFFMLRAVPGGPFAAEKSMSPEALKNLNDYYHLNDPLPRQYLGYMAGILPKAFRPTQLFVDGQIDLKAGFGMDFGPSLKHPTRTVNEIIAQRLPVSLELGVWALLIALALGLTSGVVASLRPNSWGDYVPSAISMAGICMPTFVIGPLLVLVFAVYLGWFRASGWYEPADRVLPALTLGFVYAAYIARLTRGGMREILAQDFIRTARAKGASEWRVVLRHALRGGLLPVVSYLGPALAGIVSGSFVVETIFQVPGLGREFINSAANRDYPLVTGTVLLFAVLIISFNLLVDIVAVWLNPRMRQAH